MKITLIGGGKLGKQFYRRLADIEEIELVQWVVRTAAKNKTSDGVPVVNHLKELKQSDLYLLAVSDQAIGSIAKAIPIKAFVAHCAGGVSLNVLKQKRAGAFYPLQSFSDGRVIDFSTVTFGLEAKQVKELTLLQQLVNYFGAQYVTMDSKQRDQLHLAAVLVNNFTNHLFTEAAALCEQNDLSFNLLKPLIQETVNKLETLSPKAAQTGPAVRYDQETITKHLKSIHKPKLKEIYQVLTSAIQQQ
jgi:predicted short-subunit dehydrogenase-like oxidoreductase (DUF2520 family)